jgi:RimJ/RimL family protein N-acetyltransferase
MPSAVVPRPSRDNVRTRRCRVPKHDKNGDVANIRRSVSGDAEAIGRIVVRAWQAAYRSIMPDDYLDALRPAERAAFWQRQIDSTGGESIFVAVANGEVVGFAAFGRCQDEGASEDDGQLYAINLDPDHWGKGLGRALLRAATDELAARGFKRLVLWVVPENARARKLYESEGWTTEGVIREEEVFGVTVAEIRYQRKA